MITFSLHAYLKKLRIKFKSTHLYLFVLEWKRGILCWTVAMEPAPTVSIYYYRMNMLKRASLNNSNVLLLKKKLFFYKSLKELATEYKQEWAYPSQNGWIYIYVHIWYLYHQNELNPDVYTFFWWKMFILEDIIMLIVFDSLTFTSNHDL